MLGNDVVDLTVDVKKHLNRRFIHRVLTDNEQKYLALSKHKNTYLWSLWAAKEASYKACQKLHKPLTFSPSQFELDEPCLKKLVDHDHNQPFIGSLQHQSVTLQVKLTWRKHQPSAKKAVVLIAVHATAIQGSDPEALNSVQVIVAKMNRLSSYKNQSAQVRKLATKILLSHGIKASIQRPPLEMNGYSKPGPPILVTQNQQVLSHEISLSHDNKWLAVALLIK